MLSHINTVRGQISSLRIPFSVAETLDLAKTDHLIWKSNITYMLRGLLTLNAANVHDHHVCRLGKWYFGEGADNFGQLKEFQALDALHRQFHQQCAEAIRLYQQGDTAGAEEIAAVLDTLSTEVVQSLDAIKAAVR